MTNIIFSYIEYAAISFVLIFILQYAMLWMGATTEVIKNASDAIIILFPIVGTALDVMERHKTCKN